MTELEQFQELKEQGMDIPRDFCVVGFGNEPFTKFMELSISSVDQSPLEMGKIVATNFIEQIKNNLKIGKKVTLGLILFTTHLPMTNALRNYLWLMCGLCAIVLILIM